MKKRIIALLMSVILIIPNSWVIYAMDTDISDIPIEDIVELDESKKSDDDDKNNETDKQQEDHYLNSNSNNETNDTNEVTTLSESISGENEEYQYSIDDDCVTITSYLGSSDEVTIPSQIENLPVTTIGETAFRDNPYIKTLILPDTVTCIEAGAFANCTELSDVTLSDSLEVMYAHAFYNCDKITSIKIPKSLERTENAYIYQYHWGYTYGPFYGCDGLKDITFEEGTTKIANGLFANCPGLESVVIPDTVTIIGNEAFGYSENISEVKFGANVEEIGDHAFRRCGKITSVRLNDKVTKIGIASFAECTELSDVTLSKSLEIIYAHAFYNCDKITSIEIPKSLTETKSAYIYEYHHTYTNGPFYGCDGLKDITFEEGTTKIANGLFANCPGIESVVIPDTVTIIGNEAFGYSENISEVKFGANVEEIGDHAFRRCGKITSVRLNDKVTKIGIASFAECTELSDVTLSKSLEIIYAHAFYNCDKITSIEIPKSLTETKSAYIYEYHHTYTNGPFYGCDGLKDITFEEGTTKIANGLFANCPGLESVVIPDTVTIIGNEAFGYSENISEVKFGANVEEIGDHAFRRCGKIISIKLNDKVTKIGIASFAECTELSDVTLSKSLEVIYAHAFYNCDKITSIEIPKSLKKTESAYIYEYDRGYTYGPFYGCDGLKNITFEEGTMTIVNGLFSNCPAITEFIIPETITEVQWDAFENCDNLLILDVHNNVDNFDIRAINNCDNVTILSNYGSPFHIDAIENNIPVKLKTYAYDNYDDLAIESDCTYSIDYSSLNVNGYVKVDVQYNIKDEVFSSSSDQTIYFYLPENVYIYEEQIRVNDEFCYDYVIDGRKLIFNIDESVGDISFGFKPNSVEDLSIASIYQYRLEGEVKKELLGFDNSSRSILTIETNTITSKTNIQVQGIGNAATPIDLYINDELQTTVNTLKTGSYQAELTLPNTQDGSSYIIKAVNANDENQVAQMEVKYSSAIPEMTEFKLYYNNHSDTMIDLMNAPSSPKISFYPEVPFTFVTDFSNEEQINDVYIVSTRNNERKIMEAEYNEDTGQYIASGYFDESNHSYVPGKLSVEYNLKQEEVKVGQEFDWEEMNAAISDDLKKTKVSVIENTGYDTTYRFDFSDVSADLAGVSIDMAISQFNAAGDTTLGDWLGVFKDTFDVAATVIPGLDDSKYLLAGNHSMTESVYILVKEGAELADGAIKLQIKLNPAGSFTKLSEISPYLGLLTSGLSLAGEIDGYYQDKEALINEIYQSPGITNKGEAVRRAEELFEDQSNYAVMMVLLPLLASLFGVTAPVALVFSGMLAMIGSTSTYFWEMRTYCIKNGYDIFGIDWKIDPSGFVYEAVENNRLEGVKVTAYYKENLEDTEAILWDASEYEQQNPLYTDLNGRYAWNVPEGYWQVKYEKDGYETIYSEWLPVPPPQTEVNIGMVSKEKPKIVSMNVYADHANIVFSKYMKPDTISAIKITDEKGNNIPYVLEYDQSSIDSNGVNFAKEYVLKFTNDQILTPGSVCNIIVDETIKSYSDISIDSVTQTLTVSENIGIATTENVNVKMGESIFIPVELINVSDNKSITVSSDADEIASVSDIRENGFTINANMYGNASIIVTVPGTELQKVIIVTVGNVSEEINVLPTIVIPQSSYVLDTNDSIEINPATYPETTYSGKWSVVGGEGIVSIEGNVINAIKSGEATIRYKLDEYEDVYVDCKIIVKAEYLLGDVNSDGKITYSDAVLILQSDSNIQQLTQAQKEAGDVNGDNIINYNDAVQILRYDAGLITSFN